MTSADHIFPLWASLARRGLDGSIRYFAGRLQTQFGDMHVVPDLVVANDRFPRSETMPMRDKHFVAGEVYSTMLGRRIVRIHRLGILDRE